MLCFGRKKRKQSGLLNNEATAVTDYPDTTNAVDRNKGRPASASQVYPVVQENDQSNRQHNPHEQCKNRQKASNDKVDELRAKMKRLKKERKEKKEEMTKLKDEHLRTMENQNKEHQRTVEKLQEKVSRQKIDNQELKDANNELLTRLSAMAGARLTDGNANIADLSDENRPTKLAERYSELYDNEWTDAFEVLTAGEYVSEQDACHTLCEALCAFYNACKKKANGDLENMREAIKKFLGGKEPPSELMKPLKDQRKKIHGGHIKHLKSDLKDNIHKLFPDKKKRHDERLKLFLNKGIELCWLMVIQDPSVYLDVTSCNRSGEKYESTTLKPYTQSGQYIDYIVWPPLYLNEGGNILCKGIAQCKSGVTNRISCNARPPTSEQQEITRATRTETELQESIKETKNSEAKLEGATLSVSDSYHNDRYTDPGTCSNQKESNHAKPISVGILSVTENENRSELPVLDEMLTTNEVNKHDAKTNITTVTETDGQEKMGAIDNSEFPSEVNLTDSKANFSKNYINVEPSYCQETTVTLKKEEERDHRTETDQKANLPADISIDRPGANFDTKSNDYNESNPNIIPSNAKPSVNRKRKTSNATRSMEGDRNTKTSNPNTTTAVVSSKGQTTMETSYPGFENSESPPKVKNTDDKSKQYSLTYPETGRKKKNKDNRKLNTSVGKAT